MYRRAILNSGAACSRPKILASGCFFLSWVVAWSGSAGQTWTDEEMERFLLEGRIAHTESLAIGVTGSKTATLTLEGRSHDAHLQTVDVTEKSVRFGDRTEFGFRDSYRYNIAAYRLDRLLDLQMVPVSVPRVVKGERAAVTWWVDDVLMMESDRRGKGIEPPCTGEWEEQADRRRVFSQLVHDTDANQGNLLITDDWRVWLIDFTRAFRTRKKLLSRDTLARIDSELLERLRALNRKEVETRLRPPLTRPEVAALMARRDRLVEHFERRSERAGGTAVIYERAGRGQCSGLDSAS